jgi:cytochrome c oxidase subunit 4
MNEHEHEHEHEDHIVSPRTYFIVFVALLGLMAATIGMAYIDLEPFNLAIALTIATLKGILIVLIFMHVYHSSGVVKLFVGAGFFWLIILYLFTFSDFLVRWAS